MWVAKIKTDASKSFFGQRAIKHKITAAAYPLRSWKKGKHLFALVQGYLVGPERNKRTFLEELRKMGRLPYLEAKDNFLIAVIEDEPRAEPLYDPAIIWLKPAAISHTGYELWELASWKKEPLQRVIELAQKHLDGKLLKLTEEKVGNIGIVSILPELTGKQRRALELAVEHGYYEYPRKIEVQQLAKLMKTSYATYQAHLRKAERALVPFLFARFK